MRAKHAQRRLRRRQFPRSAPFVVAEVEQALVLPDGVDELVCDQAISGVNRGDVSAVVVGNRLLILPVPQQLLGNRAGHLSPHQTVWDALSLRGCNLAEALTSESQHLGFTSDPHSFPQESIPSLGEVGPAVARPLRRDVASSAPAIQVFDVRTRRGSQGRSGPVGRTVLHLDAQIGSGELVVVRNAGTSDARTATSVLAGLEQPESGVVLHRGVPCDGNDPEHQVFVSVQPGIYAGRMAHSLEASAVDFAAYPMIVYGADPASARFSASCVLARLNGSSLDGQPLSAMTTRERQLAVLARALAGEWDMYVLFDPLRGLDQHAQMAVRSLIDQRRSSGATVVVLTDDHSLVGSADWCLAVVGGVLRTVDRECKATRRRHPRTAPKKC